MKRFASLIALALWPLIVGAALDAIDFLLGDVAQGATWSFAGALGCVTASTPTTLACWILRLKSMPACLAAGAATGVIVGGALVGWAIFTSIDQLAGPYYLLAATLALLGAGATGMLFWLVHRSDAAANPPTSAP